MIESSNFRKINEIEKKIINKSLSKISPELYQFLINSNRKLYISKKDSNLKPNYPTIYLITNDFRKNLDLIESKVKINSAGLYFGFIKKGEFYLSLEGAEFLYRQGIFPGFKNMTVNKEGEKSVLYGNHILKNMVAKTPSNLQIGDFLLISNNLNEILAIARSKVNNQILSTHTNEDLIAINLSDKGIYLRKKQ